MAGNKSPDTAILDQAAFSFRRSPEALGAVRWLKENDQDFKNLVHGFDMIIHEMNRLKSDEGINDYYYGSVDRLNKQVSGDLPTLTKLAEAASQTEKPDILATIMETFAEVGGGLPAGESWNWAAKEEPVVMASALLIEGYGLMLAKHYGDEGIKRNFVLGFEETGYITQDHNPIIKNVVKWMKDPQEIGDFSPNVQKKLQKEV